MKQNIFSYRTSATLAITLTVLMHLLFGILMWFGRSVMAIHGTDLKEKVASSEPGWEWIALSALSVFIFTFLMFLINFSVLKAEIKKYRITAIVLSSLIGTIAITFLLVNLSLLIFNIDAGENYWRILFGNMTKDLFLALIVAFIAQIFYLSQKKQQIAIENEKLIAENMQSRYQTLKNQVDPHFLFNTLNTLNMMIKLDPDKAQEYVQKMSSVFRYTLQTNEETSLEEEMKFTYDYCLLMQIRYGESLIFDFRIDKTYNNYLVIPLSIQTLVENAIKHNVISNKQPLTVSVYTTEEGSLVVSNPLQVKKVAEPGEGIGLANLNERYELRFQQQPEVTITDNIFKVKLPLIKPYKDESSNN